QADVAPLLHAPFPSQLPVVVSSASLHDGLPHVTPDAACSQRPLPLHLPSLPHVPFGVHWPAGAGAPALTTAHVPSANPVSACVHAWQTPLHALSQHTPPAQCPLRHCASAAHAVPLAPTQLPLPSHWLGARHVPGSCCPLGAFVQVPGLAPTLQAWQVPVHAVSQQLPSTQWPLVHWS